MGIKRKVLPLFFVVVLLSSMLPFSLVPLVSGISWGGGDWEYKKQFTISQTSGAGVDYPVKLVVHKGSGSDSGNDVYLDNHCEDTFYDIRIVDPTESSAWSIWNETFYSGDNVTIWFKCEGNVTDGDVSPYIYYGYSGASSVWNGSAVFSFFDDFDDGSLDTSIWDTSGTPSESGGELSLDGDDKICGKTSALYDIAFRARTKGNNWDGGFVEAHEAIDDQTSRIGIVSTDIDENQGWTSCVISTRNDEVNYEDTDVSISNFSSYNIYEVGWVDRDLYYYQNDTQLGSYTTDSDVPDESLKILLRVWDSSQASTFTYDWALMRKWVHPEPSISSWGSEESAALENTITLSSPSDGETEYYSTDLHTVNFTYTPSWKMGEIVNASLWANVSGTWQNIATNSSNVINNTVNGIEYTFSNEGTYLWNIQAYNSTDAVWGASNRTITLDKTGESTLSNFPYRRLITIPQADGAGTNYQSYVNVYYNRTSYNTANVYESCAHQGTGGASWHPMGFYDSTSNSTFVVIHGESLNPYIAYYNHTTEEWSDHYKVGTKPLSSDGHGVPTVIITEDGYIHVFYGAHGSALQHAKSDSPRDITSFTEQSDPHSDVTYQKTFIANNGSVYTFFRSNENIVYIRSDDNCSTWTGGTALVDVSYSVGYFTIDYNPSSEIVHIGGTRGGGDNLVDVFYSYYKLSDGHMYNVTGDDLGADITGSEYDDYCMVYNTTVDSEDSNRPVVSFDENDYPHLIGNIENTSGAWNTHHWYWDGSSWYNSSITQVGNQKSGCNFIVTNSSYVTGYISVNTTAGERNGEPQKWRWDGSSWSYVETVLEKGDEPLGNSQMVENKYDIEVLFSENDFDDYTTSDLRYYAYSEDGFTPRDLYDYEIDLEEKCQEDFDDIRITASDGETLWDCWNETMDGGYIRVWFEIRDNLTENDVAAYLYYGNSSVSSVFDGEATFTFFDEFDDDSFNTTKWDKSGNVTEIGGSVQIGNSTDSSIRSNASNTKNFTYPCAIKSRAKYTGDVYGELLQVIDTALENGFLIDMHDYTDYIGFRNREDDVKTSQKTGTAEDYNYHKTELRWINNSYALAILDESDETVTTTNVPDNTPELDIRFHQNGDNEAAEAVFVDYVFQRKYVSGEGTTTINEEESTTSMNSDPSAESFDVSDLTDGFKIVADGRSYSSDFYVSDADGYGDLDTGMFAFQDASGQWYNVTIDLSGPTWTRSTDCPMSVTGQAVSYPNSTYAHIETALELQSEAPDTAGVSVYAWVNDTAGASSGWVLLDADAFDIIPPTSDDDDGDTGNGDGDITPDPSSDICNRTWLQSQDIGVLVRICDSNGLAYESGATKADLIRLILCELCDMCEFMDCSYTDQELLDMLFTLQAMEWKELIEYGQELGAGTTKWDSREEAIIKIYVEGLGCPVPDQFYKDPDVPGDEWDPDDYDGDGEPNDVDPCPFDPFEDSTDHKIPDFIEPFIPDAVKPWIQRWGDEIIIFSALAIFLLAALNEEEKKKTRKTRAQQDFLGFEYTRKEWDKFVEKLKKDVWDKE